MVGFCAHDKRHSVPIKEERSLTRLGGYSEISLVPHRDVDHKFSHKITFIVVVISAIFQMCQMHVFKKTWKRNIGNKKIIAYKVIGCKI
jgi:hypothetical protein